MKITVERANTQETRRSVSHHPPSDLSHKSGFTRKPPRRKAKTPRVGVLVRREVGVSSVKRSSRPETPLLKWKVDEESEKSDPAENERSSPKAGRRAVEVVSARKLAAGLWRLHLPEFQINGGRSSGLQSADVEFKSTKRDDHLAKEHLSPQKELVHSLHSVPGHKNGLRHKLEPSYQYSNSEMEGVTKWDPIGSRTPNASVQVLSQPRHHDQQESAALSTLKRELEQARSRINELEMERRSSKKKLEQFLRKLSEERAAWRSREHEKIRAIIEDMKADLSVEKKDRQRLEMVNSKLVDGLSEAKLLAKRYKHAYEKEQKARELIEEVCNELAKEIGDDRAEVETVQRESIKLQDEVEEERKMLQMAEVWREERVQMKLVDAKVMLEEKYSYMNALVTDLESFLNSASTALDREELKKADFLRQAAKSVDIQDIRELKYEPANPDDFLSIFEDVNFSKSDNREDAEPYVGYSPASRASKIHTVSPEVKMLQKDGAREPSDISMDQNSEREEDASEWETVSHAEDQGSSYSPGGSDPSVTKNFRASNVSRNGGEWERGDETPIMEINKVRNLKKGSSISKLWRSYASTGDNYNVVSVDGVKGRLLNGVNVSPDHSGKSGTYPTDLAGQCSSPDSGIPQANRGMKGCIEWPRGAQRSSLKARLLEARMESQKIQLRQALKQKI
ncbi:actin cytoskeleton-regulatory complex protein pan-1-like [Dorcoceras hygrometricum]|nr:actin cytoskeleton-regulatory complex protein pan-1-like [Dorcoceras hygrometricum]